MKKKKKTHAFLPLVLESVDWTYTQNGKKKFKKMLEAKYWTLDLLKQSSEFSSIDQRLADCHQP